MVLVNILELNKTLYQILERRLSLSLSYMPLKLLEALILKEV